MLYGGSDDDDETKIVTEKNRKWNELAGLIPEYPGPSPKLRSLWDLSVRIKAKMSEEAMESLGL